VPRVRAFLADYRASALAIGISASVALLSWFGYRAITEWRSASISLASRRASEAADLLAQALSRDMTGVQQSVLSSPEWRYFDVDRPQDMTSLIASGFARYPYPESFFAWTAGSNVSSVVFFNRSDRPPSWTTAKSETGRFPVIIARDAALAAAIMESVVADARRGRQLSAVVLRVGDVAYHVVAQLTYADIYREHLSEVVGFTVNSAWVRNNYFSDLVSEVWQVGPGTETGLIHSVTDAQGRVVAGAAIDDAGNLTHRRQLPLAFLELDSEATTGQRQPSEIWTVIVSAADPALASAIGLANRMLIVGAASALALALGLLLMVRAERTRATLTQMRSDFVSTVTHELKTPLATIQAAANTLSRDRLNSMSIKTCSRIVAMETKRLSHLVENLLAYSRVADVADTYSFEPLDVGVIFSDVQQAFESALDQRGFELELTIAPKTARLRGDRLALRLLFSNLVDNAMKYSGQKRTLALNATQNRSNTVRIDVTDSGLGIPPDEIPLVTRKFVRGRGVTEGGSGLGLTIASRIAADHGGALEIASVLGVGTTVSVTLPAA
jgi:signal transduction histidine kinase